jgi:N-acetylmuramic acid 6-phosphate etherase
LSTGPMALTGSTRMQASTVLMLVVGLALEFGRDWAQAGHQLEKWIRHLQSVDVSRLHPFVEKEAQTYQEGGVTCYAVEDLAITVFTDTTERAPTFNLAPFENPATIGQAPTRYSLTYISVPSALDSMQAWQSLLARAPRPLEWLEVHPKTSTDYLLSFDFSRKAIEFRKKFLHDHPQHLFSILAKRDGGDRLLFEFRGLREEFALPKQSPLFDHLELKMLLNMHSTLVMGRLGRYEGNLMTWLYPSNGKLVDRAARYTQILLKQKGENRFDYDAIVRAQFAVKPNLSPQESIVHKTIEQLLRA